MRLLSELYDFERLESGSIDRDRIALSDGATELTWADAVDRIARVANVLVDLGVTPGDRVGIRRPKSVESFIGVHAILRAGAIMVPLDALAPAAHTHRVIADAGIDTVITDRRSAAICAAAGVRTLLLPGARIDDDFVDGLGGVDRVVDETTIEAAGLGDIVHVDVDAAAYLIYTSGSTGTPKGIVHTHRSALAYASAAVAEYGLTSDDHFANIAPLHFDQSTFELYAAPLVGASVLVIPEPVLRFPASVSDLVDREQVTIWYSVPYLLEQLQARGALEQRDLSRLRWVLFGGESFPPAVLADLMRRLPNARWSNVYGPAEVNQCTSYEVLAPPVATVPIGDAWPAASVRVVDVAAPTSLSATDIEDDEGMLAVASPTMMQGYWGRPELTASSIVTDTDGVRWYLTGDLVRRGDDGHLVFLGRVDHQVKVRGHRIELEAIDAALRQVDGVDAATVIADRSGDDAQLVAFVVPTGEADAGELLERAAGHLRLQLPRYAVPAEIHLVAALPRTPTGKVDRVAANALLDDAGSERTP